MTERDQRLGALVPLRHLLSRPERLAAMIDRAIRAARSEQRRLGHSDRDLGGEA